MSNEFFQLLEPKTLRENVQNSIRRAILNGDLAPGELINQQQIADKLGVSRGPIREALGQLEEEGLLRTVPYKGAFVTDITPAYIDELYSIRRVLEVFAVRRMIERPDPEVLQKAHAIVAAMNEAANTQHINHLTELDLEFHSLICLGAQHTLLMQMWKSILTGVRRCLSLRHGIYENPHDIIGSHPDILIALESKDAERASQLLDQHIKEAGELLCHAWSKLSHPPAVEVNGDPLPAN
jgi:DNA-binding GntR family transcriptional regulator